FRSASRGYNGEQSCFSAAVDVRVDAFEPWLTAQLVTWHGAQAAPLEREAPHDSSPLQAETPSKGAPSCQSAGSVGSSSPTWLSAAIFALGWAYRRAARDPRRGTPG
ncbi:MAG TPA: hypothetical protein VFQ61_20345, partial [Polyangiaceae bacterium]|nr:hypothetical protein [Polyangiaceae bacterium]